MEEEYPEHVLDWYKTQDRHGVLDELQDPSEFLNVARILLNQLTWKDIGPEAFRTFTKGNEPVFISFLGRASWQRARGCGPEWGTVTASIATRRIRSRDPRRSERYGRHSWRRRMWIRRCTGCLSLRWRHQGS